MCWLDNLCTIRERRSEMAFAPIGPVVDKVIEKSVEFVSVIGPGLKYVKTAKKVTKFSNLIKATTYTAGLVSGNTALIAVNLEAGNEILEDFYS